MFGKHGWISPRRFQGARGWSSVCMKCYRWTCVDDFVGHGLKRFEVACYITVLLRVTAGHLVPASTGHSRAVTAASLPASSVAASSFQLLCRPCHFCWVRLPDPALALSNPRTQSTTTSTFANLESNLQKSSSRRAHSRFPNRNSRRINSALPTSILEVALSLSSSIKQQFLRIPLAR